MTSEPPSTREGAIVCGGAVDGFGASWVLYVGMAGIVLLVPFGLILPVGSHHRDAAKHAPFGISDLLRSRPFLLFMVATGLCQASHAVLYSFGTLTWRAAGLSDLTISLLWGESVAVELERHEPDLLGDRGPLDVRHDLEVAPERVEERLAEDALREGEKELALHGSPRGGIGVVPEDRGWLSERRRTTAIPAPSSAEPAARRSGGPACSAHSG